MARWHSAAMDVSSFNLALPPAGAAPDWVHILPAGVFQGQDGRGPYRLTSAQAVITASLEHGAIPFDENHATETAAMVGGPAPARGWIDQLDARPDGIWAHVDWTSTGRALMEDKGYRWVSPVFTHDRTGAVLQIKSVALTNNPNLIENLKAMQTPLSAAARRNIEPQHFAVPGKKQLPIEDVTHVRDAWDMVDRTEGLTSSERAEARRRILARAKELGVDTSGWSAHTSQGAIMDKVAICTALGIPETTADAAVLTALQTARTELQTARTEITRLTGELDSVKSTYVPLAQMTELQTRLTTIENDGKTAAAAIFVDAAIKAGKPIVAGVRDKYIAMHVANPADAEMLIDSMPSINAAGPGTFRVSHAGAGGRTGAGDDADPTAAMTAEDRAVCAKMGLEPKAFMEMRKKMKERA